MFFLYHCRERKLNYFISFERSRSTTRKIEMIIGVVKSNSTKAFQQKEYKFPIDTTQDCHLKIKNKKININFCRYTINFIQHHTDVQFEISSNNKEMKKILLKYKNDTWFDKIKLLTHISVKKLKYYGNIPEFPYTQKQMRDAIWKTTIKYYGI